MAVDSSSPTPLVDAVRRTHTADPMALPRKPGVDPGAVAARQGGASFARQTDWRPRRKGHPARRVIRMAILVGLLAVSALWLSRNGVFDSLLHQADSAATELASTDASAADALHLLGFVRIRSA